MLNKKTTILIALSLTLLNTHANAGFFDNFTDNLKSGDIGSLLTDAVKDVAEEVAKGNQNKAPSREEEDEYAGTSFGSSTIYNEDEEDYDEDEYLEEEYAEKEQKNTGSGSEKEEVRQSSSFNNIVKKSESVESKPVVTNLSTRVVDKDDILLHGCLFCSQNERVRLRYKDEKNPFSGIGISKYANGTIKYKFYYSDGLPTLEEHFYESGQLSLKIPMTYNEKKNNYDQHGEVQGWHDNGQLKKQYIAVEDDIMGLFRLWHENGQLALERTQNKKCNSVGSFREWYKNGNPKIKQTYSSECKAEGLSQEWHENGQLKNEQTLKAGVPDGVATYWHENGILKQKLTWTNGYTDQFFTEYYDNGNKKIEQKKVGNY